MLEKNICVMYGCECGIVQEPVIIPIGRRATYTERLVASANVAFCNGKRQKAGMGKCPKNCELRRLAEGRE